MVCGAHFSTLVGGTSGMRRKHLKIWLAMAWSEEKPDPSRWIIVVEMVQLEFETGELETKFTQATTVLLPNGGV